MSKPITDDSFFESLARAAEPVDGPLAQTPSRLKAKVYSALLKQESGSGPLLSVSATEESGRALCVFEKAVEVLPVGEGIKSLNFCRICHARVAAEKLENAPIYWPHCPYSEFQNR
jgi:hypothetical protein